MGNKRIYLGSETSKYALIAGVPLVTITSLFFVLMAVGFTITGSDDFCKGTLDDPCVSYGKICNLGPDNYDIYNPDEVKLDFSPNISNYWIFFKDGRVKKEVLTPIGINQSTSGWRYENFTNATKPLSDRVYVHRFAAYSCQDYMLVVLKNNPGDTIKWGMGVKEEYLDPFFYANSVVTDMDVELGSQINITANVSGAATSCVNISHPDYNDSWACGTPSVTFPLNITYFRKTIFNDSSSETNLTLSDGANQTFYIQGHQYDEVDGLSLNFTGYQTDGTYPTNVKVYINGSLSNSLGLVGGSGDLEINYLNDSSTEKNLTFTGTPPQTVTDYFNLPKSAIILDAYLNLTGYNYTRDYPSGIYDEIDDSSIDTNLWTISTTSQGYCSEGASSLSCGINVDAPGTGSATASTKDLPSLEELNSVSFNGSNDIQGTSIARFSIFGTVVYNSDSNGATLDINATKNTTATGNGTYYYDVYVNGAFSQQISTTSNNVVSLYVARSYAYDTVSGQFDFVYYTSDDSIKDPKLEVGILDGVYEWQYSGLFEHQNQTDNLTTALQTYLDSCTEDSNGYCVIPFYLTSSGRGNVSISAINLTYYNNLGVVSLNTDLVEGFLGNSSGYADIPITITNNYNGTLQVNDLRYDYAGGNDTIQIVVYEEGNYANNDVLNVNFFYSDWDYSFPNNVDYLEFIPSTPTSQNVTPYGQTSNVPMINLTSTNYGGKDYDFLIYLNETQTDSCVNLSLSTNSTKGFLIENETWMNISINSYGDNAGLWLWADYSCNYTNWNVWEPGISFRACCSGCVCSEET